MKSFRLTLAAAALLVAAPAFATNGMRMIGFGPVQDSMGGASVGAPLDASIQVTNPAGLVDVGTRADFGAIYFNPSVKAADLTMSMGAPTPTNLGTFESKRPASPIPSVALAYQIDKGLAFGVGMWGVAGMGVDYANAMGYSSYSQMRFTPSLAYRFGDVLSLGVTLNGMWAQMEASGFQGASAFGVGATVGVLVTPAKDLNVGLAYETKSMFQDFTFQNSDGTKSTIAFDQPATATLGAGYRVVPDLLLAVDLEWINWSDTNGKDKPVFKVNGQTQPAFNLNWDDQFVVKVGGEYDAKVVKVRLGYNYGKAPLAKGQVFENFLFPAIAEHHVTAGVGIPLGAKAELNVNGMYSPEAKLASSGYFPNPQSPTNPIPTSVTMKMSQWELGAGLTIKM